MPHTLTHAAIWIVGVTLAIVVNRYVQRWLSEDMEEPNDAALDATPPVVASVAPPQGDRPWLRPIWARRQDPPAHS
jgi:hypothetical protein